MINAQTRWIVHTIRAIPLLMAVVGLVLVVYFGWKYLWETVWVNQRPLPLYRPVNAGPLWTPPPAEGDKIGELIFPRQHAEIPVVQGTSWTDLELGAGHYMPSALPGQGSNVYVAGHRDTVFRVLRDVKPGDSVAFATPYGVFIYRVTTTEVVPPTALYETRPTPYETLTLQTCWPFSFFGFAPMRYIVHTQLVSAPNHLPA
ncbi:MAG: class D sortase [Thermoflavifilum sp.]|nr:class D sortase [Thermoflavifilum sp.]MCL6512899.1 class D sortase [Alicyclobacillus sp.]